jgi:tetratricopeptide (TPR) repeat protein
MKVADSPSQRLQLGVPSTTLGSDRGSRSAGSCLVLVVGLMVLTCAAVAVDAAPQGDTARRFPSPVEGPGHPRLDRSQRKKVEKTQQLWRKGKPDKAVKTLRRLDSGPAQDLLRFQIGHSSRTSDQLPAVQRLTADHPAYAAAWMTLLIVARDAEDEATAYQAAGRVVELWPGSTWANQAEQTRRDWVDGRIARARKGLPTGNAEQALDEVHAALELDPGNHEGLMVQAQTLVELERFDDAASVLGQLGTDTEALMLAGRVAELSGDLVTAMDRYGAAPPETPGRDEALRRVQMTWRMSVLPAYVQDALASEEVSRADLAVLIVNLVPQVEALGGGTVPLLSDILDLPSHREIVTVARLGLLSVDRLEHRFGPDEIAEPDDIRSAIDRLNDLLGLAPLVWCNSSAMVSSCMELAAPVSGKKVADMVMSLVHGESY